MEQGVEPFLQIERSAKKIARKWGIEYIGLNTLKRIIDEVRKNVNEMDTAIVGKQMIDDYNRVFDQLYQACEKRAETMHSKNVSIEYLQKMVQIIVRAYKDEFTKAPDHEKRS